ncbi:E3 ubiquitin-protein ligase TRIM23-like [Hydractinia symbiolongicarpus]|uniref:E3 ubiquitin-protein ligase TRIM23-like n=1 Tax=Hydractinia symbiolongicarpus TaxID=13093 RepID=UPI00254CCB9F|nr:E3 ubiquitin-protein ligase TRIM23-like [Hydractinia symbiolongicarpus]
MAGGGGGSGNAKRFLFDATPVRSPLSPNSRTRLKRNNALECRICEDIFTLQGDKVPRLLSCGHSVCHECLSKIQTHDLVIQCPFDRMPTQMGDSGIWGLKKNFALLELLERISQNKEESGFSELTVDEQTTFTKCDEDNQHKATLYCTVCLTNLCEKCAKESHTAKTLSLHKHVSLSEKPKINPPCSQHPSHVLEFACLEETCRENPLMCYICKDYGKHKGHKHVLIGSEADNIRNSITNAVQHVKTFSGEVSEFGRKLAEMTEKIEGVSVAENSRSNIGTAEKARLRVHEYFTDLRDTIQQQEDEALHVINTYVREKLCALRQQQEDMNVLVSQISNVCVQCDHALQRSDAEVIQARSNIVTLLDTVQQQQQVFTDLAVLCTEDPNIPFAFTKDNRVHIGPKMEMRVVALGLDNGGKTSILFKLKQNEFVPAITTIGFNVETIEHKNVKFTIWDVGGVQKLRPLWRHYYLKTQAVIFVIDSTNADRLSEAHDELSKLVAEKRLQEALVLIYANKQDLPNAISVDELRDRIGIHRICSGRTWTMIGCSAHTGDGLQEGLDWMARQFLSEFEP